MKFKGLFAAFVITSALLVGCSDDKKEDTVEETAENEVFENGAVSKDENEGLTSIQETVAKEKKVADVTTEILSIEQIAKVEIVFKKGAKDDEKAKVIEKAMAELEEKFPNHKPNVITSEEE